MTLQQIRNIVDNSVSSDWHKIEGNIIERWEWGQQNGQNYTQPISHDMLAVFKSDVDVSMAWGAVICDAFSEPWHKKLPDPSAKSVLVVLRHNGAKVDDWTFVNVDGGRYIVPLPHFNNGAYEIPVDMMPLGNLVFDLYSAGGVHSDLSVLLSCCGVKVV